MHRSSAGVPCGVAYLIAFSVGSHGFRSLPAADSVAARHAEADALLTHENYDKIANGMTADEVKAILGKPPMGAGTKGDWTNTWSLSSDKKQTIKVHFKDGLVDRKSNTMSWTQPGETVSTSPPPSAEKKPRGRKGDTADSPLDDKLNTLLREAYIGDAHKRAAAVRSIGKLPVDEKQALEVVNRLAPLLREKDLGLSADAQGVLRKWVTKDCDDVFLKMLEKKPKTTSPTDPERDRLEFAISVLAKLKEPRAVEPLCKILHWSFFDRNAAADALKEMGPEIAQAEVLKYLNDPDTGVQQKVREILDEYKKSGGAADSAELDQLIADLKAEKPETRFHTANKLAQMPVNAGRRREVAAHLVVMLSDRPSSVNQDIKTSQKNKSGNGLGNLLGEMMRHPANAAMAALIKWGGPENEEAVLAILREKDSTEDMKVGALRALAAWGTAKSVPAIQSFAKNPGNPLASAAENAIKTIGDRAKK